MTDLTPHQRDILIAMLQGRDIEFRNGPDKDIEWLHCENPLNWINGYADQLRVAHNQDEAMRLYGYVEDKEALFMSWGDEEDTHYIDISPNGFIVGGKIEDIAK